MNPNIAVFCIQRDTIVKAGHNSKIAKFHTLHLSYQKAKAPDNGIIADTFNGDIHLGICLAFNLYTFIGG